MNRIVRGGRRRVASALSRLAQIVRPPEPSGLGLVGSRDIEWSWVLSHLKTGPGNALDLGPGPFTLLTNTAAQRGYEVLALDRQRLDWPFVAAGVTLRQGDILTEELPPNTFDLIINCSTIEHVGLAGRYGTTQFTPDGDLEAMRKLLRAIKSSGDMLLTVPVGLDALFAPLHRVYGEQRLPRLLEGWRVEEERYWVKTADNQWGSVTRQRALSIPGSERLVGLGCFVLTKETEETL